jgi:hypothetical protein
MGFEALFIGRINDVEKNLRKKHKQKEFMWQPRYERAEGSKIY